MQSRPLLFISMSALVLAAHPVLAAGKATGKTAAPAPPASSPPQVVAPVAPPAQADQKPVSPPLPPPPSWSAEEISSALNQCNVALAGVDIDYRTLPAMRTETCGSPAPMTLVSVANGGVAFDGSPTVNCPMAKALATWIKDSVQPAAASILGSPVKRIAIATSYQCRNRYGRSSGPISEHAFANAVDLMGFVLQDGRAIRVKSGWEKQVQAAPAEPLKQPAVAATPSAKKTRTKTASVAAVPQVAAPPPSSTEAPSPSPAPKPERAESVFLRQVHHEACATFWTVLGPEANAAHHDHFHLDMKVRRSKHICE